MYTPQPNKKKISEISKRVSKSETKAPLSKCKAERHHKILFVGEGNFSFSTSLLEKHNKNHHTNEEEFLKITASDLKISKTVFNEFKDNEDVLKKTGLPENTYECCEVDKKCENCLLTIENIESLISSQCNVIFGLDATKIHEPNERYSKIYWSMPHDRSSFYDPSLPNLISDFCLSCSKVQELGDKVHLIISQNLKHEKKTYHTEFQQGMVYNIIESPFIAGYTLEKRIIFNNQRYTGYKHQQTAGTKKIENGESPMEFVFKKSHEILEDFRIIAKKLRMVCTASEMDLKDNDIEQIEDYKEIIKTVYNDEVLFNEYGIHRRFYIGDDKYKPEINSDNYYESDESDESDKSDKSEPQQQSTTTTTISTLHHPQLKQVQPPPQSPSSLSQQPTQQILKPAQPSSPLQSLVDDESDDNGGDGSDGADELPDLLKNLSTSDKEKKTAD